MTYKELDFFFPFIVLAYGVLMSFVLNSKSLMRLAEEKFPIELQQQMNGHRLFALISMVVGTIWSMQNLWFSPW